MANKTSVTMIGACANEQCRNDAHGGQFAVVTIQTGANVGDGSGLIQLIMCSPCAAAIASDSVSVLAPEAGSPRARLSAVQPKPEPIDDPEMGGDPDF